MTTDMIITERALVRRINRELARRGEPLSKTRRHDARWHEFDVYRNIGLLDYVNLEALGRKLGVLSPGEGIE
jgi:hypothetical protein